MVKNHLKSVKDITAPLNWQSSPDHPPAQLAYITQDEIDMLVDANIYGSMDGKPNKGPKGIISLQGDYRDQWVSPKRSTSSKSTSKGQDRHGTGSKSSSSRPSEMFEVAAKPREKGKKSDLERKIVALQRQAKDRGAESAQDYVNISQGKRTQQETIDRRNQERIDQIKINKELAKEEKKKKLLKISSGFSGFPTAMGMGMEMLQSFGIDKKEILMKLYQDPKGSTLTPRERKAVAGLISSGQLNPDVFKTDWTDEQIGTLIDTATVRGRYKGDELFEGDWNPEWYGEEGTVRDLLKQEYGMGFYTNPETNEALLKGLFKDDKDYERMIDEYYEGKPTGLGGIFGIGEEREEGTATLEDLREGLTSEEEHYLKMNRPDLYYKFNDPQTSGGIADLAGMDAQKYTSGPNYNKELAQKIFDARQELDRRKDRHDGGGGGITTLPGTTPPGTTPPGTTPGAENQWATASPGQIGYYNPEINPATGMPWGYQWGTTSDYNPYAEVNLAKGGIIGMDRGGYLDDYQAADSLMFKDPQEDEEWEYNV